MCQKFIARDRRTNPDGSTSWAPGGPFDCLGHFAKIQNCRVHGSDVRLTCYATGYADTFFSVPACTRRRGVYVSGFFTADEQGPVFHPHTQHVQLFT